MKKTIYLMLTISIILILAACGNEENKEKDSAASNEDESKPFTIGIIPVQTVGAMEDAMDKLESTLNKKMKRDVSIEIYPDYNGVVAAMNYGKIDMAYFGPLTYVIEHAKSGAKAIITQLIDGEPFYHSYIITNSDNPWNSLDELLKNPEKVTFAFGDPSSTSGSLIPGIELEERGVYKNENEYKLKAVQFTGSHDATALAVQNKQVDAGAIDSAIFNQLVDAGKIDEDKVKVIWKSDKIFQYPWAVSKNTDKKTIEKLQKAFLSIDDKEILNVFGATGFTKASNEDYKSVRKAAIKEGFIEE